MSHRTLTQRTSQQKKVNERDSLWEAPKPLFYTIEEQADINSLGYFSADCSLRVPIP